MTLGCNQLLKRYGQKLKCKGSLKCEHTTAAVYATHTHAVEVFSTSINTLPVEYL